MSGASIPNINKKDTDHRTELHLAAEKNEIKLVEQLLSQGADINARDKFDLTPLHLSAQRNIEASHYAVNEILLKNGADINASDQYGQTPLINLIGNANLDSVILFLNFNADFRVLDCQGRNLLFNVVGDNKKVEIVQLLVDLGLSANNCSKDGKTLLHELVEKNEDGSLFKVAEILLKNGAEPSPRNEKFHEPLFYLVQNGNVEIVQLFLDFKANVNGFYDFDKNLLFFATNNFKNPEILQLLIDLNLEVNHKSIGGITPLHEAAKKNTEGSHYKVIEILLKNGADSNAQDKFGITPLWWLAKNGDINIVQLLLNFRANVHLVNYEGCNLLFQAVDNKNVEVLQLLTDRGLDANHTGIYGQTPLHRKDFLLFLKIRNKNIKCLLKNGANINAADNRGHTPLIVAVQKNNFYGLAEKKIENNFNFILEHSDFNQIHNNINILTFHYKNYQDFLWKMILKHIAKLTILEIPVHPHFLKTISEVNKYNDYFNLCRKELLLSKNTKLRSSWSTYYHLLTDDRRKLKNYAGNKNLIEVFKSVDCRKKFLVYGATMIENVEKGIKRRKLFDESSIILSQYLPIFNPNHLIIKDILDCIMSKKDLSKICN